FKASDQGREQGEPAIIAGLVRELLLTYGLDQKRVYVAGLSAGGAMAVILGRMYPDMFAAMRRRGTTDPRGERLESAHVLRSSVPTIVFHGDRDVTVHPDNGEQVA